MDRLMHMVDNCMMITGALPHSEYDCFVFCWSSARYQITQTIINPLQTWMLKPQSSLTKTVASHLRRKCWSSSNRSFIIQLRAFHTPPAITTTIYTSSPSDWSIPSNIFNSTSCHQHIQYLNDSSCLWFCKEYAESSYPFTAHYSAPSIEIPVSYCTTITTASIFQLRISTAATAHPQIL